MARQVSATLAAKAGDAERALEFLRSRESRAVEALTPRPASVGPDTRTAAFEERMRAMARDRGLIH